MGNQPANEAVITRLEFEQFLQAFTHEIRNKLNGIALEASDLAEQAGGNADASRLQRQVQECSAFLKKTRDILAPDSIQDRRTALDDFLREMRGRK